MSHISSTSKGLPAQKSFDELISAVPLFSPSVTAPSSSFRTTSVPLVTSNDPELFMGDDCDASYEAALLNAGLLDWLESDDTVMFHNPLPHKRLEMLLLHLTTTTDDKKGKKKLL